MYVLPSSYQQRLDNDETDGPGQFPGLFLLFCDDDDDEMRKRAEICRVAIAGRRSIRSDLIIQHTTIIYFNGPDIGSGSGSRVKWRRL